MTIIFLATVGTILFLCSLRLEAESLGKDSIEYKRLKKTGVVALISTWGGITLIGLIMILFSGLQV